MDLSAQFNICVDALGQLGIEVRIEPVGTGRGGLLRLRDQRILMLDAGMVVAERLDACLEVLAAEPGGDRCFLPPVLRERLDAKRRA